jgi:oxygen-independent coproporphyrinogen III oxidase
MKSRKAEAEYFDGCGDGTDRTPRGSTIGMKHVSLHDMIGWSRREFESELYQNIIRSGLIQRERLGLGGSHSVVTYPPLDCLRPLAPEEVLGTLTPVSDLNIYLHVAFCEFVCGFCHYETRRTDIEKTDERVSTYIRALRREIGFWTDRLAGSSIESVYIGGGTPTVAGRDELLGCIAAIEKLRKSSNFRACVETSPMTAGSAAGRDKITALLEAGINRVSMGIQTFDGALLRVHRGHELPVVLTALEFLLNAGVEINIDLIQDLPGQTDESIIDDILQIESLRPHQVTWYILRLHKGSSWFQMLPRLDKDLIQPEDSARRRAMIRKAMISIGYEPRPGGRFVRDHSINDTYKAVRAATEPYMIGIGASAYSHGWGYIFRNEPASRRGSGLENYVARAGRGECAIESGMRLDSIEKAAGKMVSGIRARVRPPEPTVETEDYLVYTKELLQLLKNLGLVSTDEENFYSLTEAGCVFEEEICSLFYSRRIRNLLSDAPARGLVLVTRK